MADQEEVDRITSDLRNVRDFRIDSLPDRGALIEVIADAMNALEVAYIMLTMEAKRKSPVTPQGAHFVSVSTPQDVKPL